MVFVDEDLTHVPLAASLIMTVVNLTIIGAGSVLSFLFSRWAIEMSYDVIGICSWFSSRSSTTFTFCDACSRVVLSLIGCDAGGIPVMN